MNQPIQNSVPIQNSNPEGVNQYSRESHGGTEREEAMHKMVDSHANR
jgi:hypothetical protein